jgi:hypothetical protein
VHVARFQAFLLNAVDMRFILETVDKKDIRNEDVGDWIPTAYGGYIKGVDLGDADMNFVLLVHELVEFYLCMKNGVTDEQVTAFDASFLASGKPGEAGNDPDAPYAPFHDFATVVEHLIANKLGIPWETYDQLIEEYK